QQDHELRDRRTLQFTSLSFDVSFQEIFSTWCSGGTLVLIEDEVRRDGIGLLHYMHEQGIERLFTPFVALQQLAEVAQSEELIPDKLRAIYTAGEQLQVTPTLRHLFESLQHRCILHNQYGPSESHVVTSLTLSREASKWVALPPVGRPIANTKIYILDSHLQPVPVEVPGELYIGGVALARGYFKRPDLTAERFLPNPHSQGAGDRIYKTGDLVRYLPGGNIEFLGRIDNQVKVRGHRIELGEIETILAEHTGVREAIVVARENERKEKRLVAYVVAESETVSTPADLREHLKKRVPEYMIPSAFVLLNELPLTPSGKVDRRSLPEPEQTGFEVRGNYIAPRNTVEKVIVRVWQDVLSIELIGIFDNYFD